MSDKDKPREICDEVQDYILEKYPDVVFMVMIGINKDCAINSNGNPVQVLETITIACERQILIDTPTETVN